MKTVWTLSKYRIYWALLFSFLTHFLVYFPQLLQSKYSCHVSSWHDGIHSMKYGVGLGYEWNWLLLEILRTFDVIVIRCKILLRMISSKKTYMIWDYRGIYLLVVYIIKGWQIRILTCLGRKQDFYKKKKSIWWLFCLKLTTDQCPLWFISLFSFVHCLVSSDIFLRFSHNFNVVIIGNWSNNYITSEVYYHYYPT